MQTIVVESLAPGGQAGHELEDRELSRLPDRHLGPGAGRPRAGAGAEVRRAARDLARRRRPRLRRGAVPARARGRQSIRARAVVVATGARYRKLDVAGYERFEGAGIHYAATAMEASLCAGEEVVVVGGGNSAGQAAVFLSRTRAHVHMLVRGAGLAATMSDYLVQRIERSPRITLHPHTEITALAGDAIAAQRHLDRPRAAATATTRPARNIFVMIGAEPNTEWVAGCLDARRQGLRLHRRERGRRRRLALRDLARPASSPSATCAPARSSASPRASAKARSSSRRSTATSTPRLARRRRAGAAGSHLPTFGNAEKASATAKTLQPAEDHDASRPTDDEDTESLTSRLGPGLITGAADDDPSGIATYSQAGAQFRFALVWTLFLTTPLMIGIQMLSARIGWVTRQGLATNIGKLCPRGLTVSLVGLLVVANTINIAADIAAMAEAVKLLVGGPQPLYVLASARSASRCRSSSRTSARCASSSG